MSKFQKPPLTQKEKDRLAENFIEGAARLSPVGKKDNEKKEIIFLRIPKSLHDDLERICNLTGYKKNMFCLQSILEAAKEKLRQIERET